MDEINRHNMIAEMTMWHDEATWFPFIEDENCNITGPGHRYAQKETDNENQAPDRRRVRG